MSALSPCFLLSFHSLSFLVFPTHPTISFSFLYLPSTIPRFILSSLPFSSFLPSFGCPSISSFISLSLPSFFQADKTPFSLPYPLPLTLPSFLPPAPFLSLYTFSFLPSLLPSTSPIYSSSFLTYFLPTFPFLFPYS